MGGQNSTVEKTTEFLAEFKHEVGCEGKIDNYQSITLDGSGSEWVLDGCSVEITNEAVAGTQCDMSSVASNAMQFIDTLKTEQGIEAGSLSGQNMEIDMHTKIDFMTDAINKCESDIESGQEITIRLPKKITCDNSSFIVGNGADLASTCLMTAAVEADAQAESGAESSQTAEGIAGIFKGIGAMMAGPAMVIVAIVIGCILLLPLGLKIFKKINPGARMLSSSDDDND